MIQAKENQVNILKQEINLVRIEEQLKVKKTQDAIKKFKNKKLLSYCEKKIQDLLDNKLIRKSKSPWSCSTFYVQKQTELEKWTPRLVINYKPLNDALRWTRYPIPNKKDLLQMLVKSKVFSKFDLKSGFW